MSGIPQSFQRRTDDLYLLKTRNLVFENVDGTFPVKGALSYTTNSVGVLGFSSVTADTSGNLTIPGTTTMGANNGYVIVDGGTGTLTAKQDVDIFGKLTVYNVAQVNALDLLNTTDGTTSSQLYDTTTDGVETLEWLNAAQVKEPISGWNAKLTPSTGIFRTVDTTGLSGATLIMAQNQNALLTLFQQRGVFLTTLTNDPNLAAVFNTSLSITFIISGSQRYTYSIEGNPAKAVSYTDLANSINDAIPILSFASYSEIDGIGTFTFTVGSGYTLEFVDTTENGTAQLFLNHLNTSLFIDTPYSNTAVSTVLDFTEVMPATPTAAPTDISGSIDVSNCTITIPVFPATPIAIENVCVYWCISGSSFSSSPNAIIPASQQTYRITGLTARTTYKVAISYRSLYDESPRGPVDYFTTKSVLNNSAMYFSSNTNVYSVEVTQDVNWISTPSYGTSVIKYNKPYASNVRFTVATVFSAIWKDTLADLTNLLQIQSVTIEVYAGTAASTTNGARFYTGTNHLTNIVYVGTPTEAKYGDAVGLGGSIDIYPDTAGIDILRNIFNADKDGNIGVGKNIVFGWYSTQGGLRNCEVTRFNVIYTV